ncbi:MAG: hypothetical protein Q8R22_02750 [Flavobacterium sp.]|uniref:hypothetical protein n=1 Tax=Flavobacterium sp. TaxID=239 RepID=UPI0027343EA5|nr:hypothetical protein [Flavobacterium sp.]MDP3679737.1 hypothetical protein [Flavobacterium sp.]MDZ4329173.1 hypothetical protein [Flavobacterium sp.]
MVNTKKFRLNVIVSYDADININNYRNPILSIIKNFAWLYRLDYKIDENSQVFGDTESEFHSTVDLVYLRSTELTSMDLKKFQKLILDVFGHLNPLLGGVEVFYQLQKALREYPFPSEYIRPLNYPYLEFYKDGQSEIKIPSDDLQRLFPDLHIE